MYIHGYNPDDGAGDSIEADRKHAKSYWKRVGVLFLIAVLLYGFAVESHAEPLLRATAGNVVITIHSEECALKDVVTNLPKRATWEEAGKTYEGCAGAIPQLGVAMFYFVGDKTVAVVPGQMFVKVQSL